MHASYASHWMPWVDCRHDANTDEHNTWRQSIQGTQWLARGHNTCPIRKNLSANPFKHTQLEKFMWSNGLADKFL